MTREPRNRRAIYDWISRQTPTGGRVLDIGCGDGALLALLAERRQVRGTGIEIDEQAVASAVQRGLSVHHGNVEEGLDHYADAAFDLVIMSLTIQEMADPAHVLREAARVGRQSVVVFPNFAYWRSRWQLALCGRAPILGELTHTWYDSPNRHFLTILDWEAFCRAQGWRCRSRAFLTAGRSIRCLPNLRAEVALYLIEKP